MKKIKNYVLDEKIGIGKYGIVFKGIDLNTNKTVAIKLIRKCLLNNSIKRELLLSELNVMKKLQEVNCNTNIIKFLEYIETARNCYIIMEYCNDGDLKQYLQKFGCLSEENSINKMKQILNGMKSLNDNNIIHRDLKTANIFIHDGELKIGDFGFATEGEYQQLKLGTPLYMAPELLSDESYSTKVDVWALGIIFYQMLFGQFPFKATTEKKILEATKIPISFDKLEKKISNDAQIVLEKMLEPDQNKRISLQQLLKIELFNSNKHQNNPEKQKFKDLCNSVRTDTLGDSTKDTTENYIMNPSQQIGEQQIYSNLACLFQQSNYSNSSFIQ